MGPDLKVIDLFRQMLAPEHLGIDSVLVDQIADDQPDPNHYYK